MFKQGTKELLAMGTAAIAASAAILKVTDMTVKSSVALENFNKQTGLSIDLLQKWQKAGALSDVELTTEKIAENIKGLQHNLQELQFGGGNTQAFRWLGIDVSGMNAFEVLEKVRTSIKDLDNVQATNLLQKMGLSPNFINVLRTSREEFEKLGQGWFLSSEERKKLVEVGTALTRMKLEFIEIRDKAIATFTPDIINLIDNIKNFTTNIYSFIKALRESETGLMVFKAGIVGIALIFAPVITKMAALILLVEDLYVLFSGGDSAIGAWFKDILQWVGDITNAMTEWIKSLTIIGEIFSGLETAMGWLDGAVESVTGGIFEKLTGSRNLLELITGDSAKEVAGNAGASNNNSNANVTNNYEINTTAPAEDVAQQIVGEQAKMFNNTLGGLLGGTQ